MARFDVIVVGAGHNGLVAATLLARTGRSVLVLERAPAPGGAAVSATPFAGHDVRLSRYSYLVSLFPRGLARDLGLGVELRRRAVSSYTPWGDTGVLIGDDAGVTRASFVRTLGSEREYDALARWAAGVGAIAGPAFASLTEPLRSRAAFARLVGGTAIWRELFEAPLADALRRRLDTNLVRGIVATDALIGTFAALDDASLRQNRCFLYHVIGNGTGRWDVPVGGMGAITDALIAAATRAGARLACGVPAIAIDTTDTAAAVRLPDGSTHEAGHVLGAVAPTTLAALLGDPAPDPAPEGSQLKLNLLLTRLPRLRDRRVTPDQAFAGTFHVNEAFDQLQAAHAAASQGRMPNPMPCEAYCHSLTDPSILGPQLRSAGAHTLTVFALHTPARLFATDPAGAKRTAVAATLASLNSVLAEPIEECLARDADGRPCLEARTPVELQDELGLPAGHIFHRDLAWPYAEHDEEVGGWGVETERPTVWLCGAGARRGGGVSGIPGHNAVHAVIAADARRSVRRVPA